MYRLVAEPDYRHAAWLVGDEPPDPRRQPEAFTIRREPVPRPSPHPNRAARPQPRAPRERLSLAALRDRLFRAGVRGARVDQLAREIHAGPRPEERALGFQVLGWPVGVLKARLGRRHFRAVTRFVKRELHVLDEGWSLQGSDELADVMRRSMAAYRMRAPFVEVVVQTTAGLAGLAGRLEGAEHVLDGAVGPTSRNVP